MTPSLSPSDSSFIDAAAGRVRVVASGSSGRAALVSVLTLAGFEVECDGDEAGEGRAADTDLLAVVLWHAAEEGPLAELVRARAARGVRVLAFTDAQDEATLVGALEAGARQVFRADESERVMLARLMAALRRPASQGRAPLEIEPFTFELARRLVHLHGEALDLSPREFDLAYYLFGHRGRVVTNAELLTSVWSLPQGIDSRRIDTAVCRVRRKMHLGSDSGWVLRRFRREGYGLYQDSRDAARAAAATPPTGEERRGTGDPDDDQD